MFAGVDGSEPALQDAEEHLPAALRLRLPGRTPRRSSAAASGCSPASWASGAATCSRTATSQTTTIGTTINAFGAPIPRRLGQRAPHHADPGAGRQRARPADRASGRAITFFNQNPERLEAAALADRLPARAAGRLRRSTPPTSATTATTSRSSATSTRCRTSYLNTDNSRTAGDERQQHLPDRPGPEPVRRPAAGHRLQQRRPSPAAAAAPVPRLRRHQRPRTTTASRGTTPPRSSLQKRFSKGYTLGLAYTYSRWMQATEYLNAGDAHPTRMISDLDVPHRLSVSGIFELPVREGPAVPVERERAHRTPSLGGWQIQGVYTYQTGFPVPFGNPASATSFAPTASDALLQRRRPRSRRRADHRPVVQHGRLHVDPERTRRRTRRRSTTCGRCPCGSTTCGGTPSTASTSR